MRQLLLATVLAGCAWTVHAQAEPTTWNFSYTGFYLTSTFIDRREDIDETTAAFRPDITLKGSFSGADSNHDGTIALSELSALEFNGTDYYGCVAAPSPYGRCTIAAFSYALNGALPGTLDFSATHAGEDEFYSGWSSSVTSGVRATETSYRLYTDSAAYYDWTGQTRFSITQVPPPVPEPAGGAMAAAGVLLLGLLARQGRVRPPARPVS